MRTACDGRIKELKIFVSQNPITNYNTQTTLIYSSSVGLKDGDLLNFNNLNLSGRYVKVWGKNSGTATWLHLVRTQLCQTKFIFQNYNSKQFENSTVTIYNILGRVLFKTDLVSNKIDLKSISKGTYIIILEVENRKYIHKIFKL
ncbi:MAG: T9SS type A sorting domain-containing protein [Saprospiraceae bacterium]|nr:T9SS type A sorting domain-containing protein [Saprospiraceae bacterium]